jgi:hypothetical protein
MEKSYWIHSFKDCEDRRSDPHTGLYQDLTDHNAIHDYELEQLGYKRCGWTDTPFKRLSSSTVTSDEDHETGENEDKGDTSSEDETVCKNTSQRTNTLAWIRSPYSY